MIINGQYINDKDIIKIYRNRYNGEYEALLNVYINLNNNYTNTMIKTGIYYINEFKLSDNFIVVDDDLIVNLDNILMTTKDNSLFLKSISKKDINGKFINYNIKISNNVEENFEKVSNYTRSKIVVDKYGRDVLLNTSLINNIVVEDTRLIVNFVTNVSLGFSDDIIPSFEIIDFSNDIERDNIIDEMIGDNFRELFYNKRMFINLDNVYLIKVDERRNRLIYNFNSNIYKVLNDKRVLSTVHVYEQFEDTELLYETFNELSMRV